MEVWKYYIITSKSSSNMTNKRIIMSNGICMDYKDTITCSPRTNARDTCYKFVNLIKTMKINIVVNLTTT